MISVIVHIVKDAVGRASIALNGLVPRNNDLNAAPPANNVFVRTDTCAYAALILLMLFFEGVVWAITEQRCGE